MTHGVHPLVREGAGPACQWKRKEEVGACWFGWACRAGPRPRCVGRSWGRRGWRWAGGGVSARERGMGELKERERFLIFLGDFWPKTDFNLCKFRKIVFNLFCNPYLKLFSYILKILLENRENQFVA